MATTKSRPAPIYLKKITTRDVRLSTAQMEEIAQQGAPDPVPVMRAYGRIRAATQGQGTYGPWTKFHGEIEAENIITGEIYRATSMCLPPMGEQMLVDMLEGRQNKDEWVQFGLDVTVEFNDSQKGGTKFCYGVQPLMKPAEAKDDLLAQMASKLPEVKKLPAPKKGK